MKDELTFHPIPNNGSLVISMSKTYNSRDTFKTIAILNGKLEISKNQDCKHLCQKFLENMIENLYISMQSIVDYNTNGSSGHLVLFFINETLMYCTQEYPSEQHSQMVWFETKSIPILMIPITVQIHCRSSTSQLSTKAFTGRFSVCDQRSQSWFDHHYCYGYYFDCHYCNLWHIYRLLHY